MPVIECKDCKECMLRRDGICPVPGEGDLDANVMFVGRDPGETENRFGRPFVGASGKFLREEIELNFAKKDIFITNMVKCHTMNNMGPLEDQILSCFKILESEITSVLPNVIVALGKTVSDYLISNPNYIYNVDIRKKQMFDINGKEFEVNILGYDFIVIPMYHPSPRNFDKYELIRNGIREISETYGTNAGTNEKEIERNEEIEEEGKNSME